MRRAVVLLCALALVLTGAVPAEAAHSRKGRPKCSKVVKRSAKGKRTTRKVCRKPARRAPARRPATKAKPKPGPRPTAVAPPRTVAAPALPVPAPLAPSAPPAPGAPAGVPAPAPAPAPPAAAAPACDPSPWLGARAEDADGVFRLVLTRGCVPAGRVLVQLVNRDLQPHNVYVQGIEPAVAPRAVVADVDGEATGTGEVDLAPGRWRFFCAIEGHEAMAGTVTATR